MRNDRHIFKSTALLFLVITALLFGSSYVFAEDFTVFGPQVYIRQQGSPEAVEASFSVLNPEASYKIYLICMIQKRRR